ncbi:putative serine/threonine-protein kinase GCN2 [Platanthera guangdongensis]|uniref:Serine/threonine-protein kinase GCN2 n=1 Tax=Platanthera guangdongensis TaxID=2320717 RepID=A0ABR2M4P2_9ASPA
MAAGNGSEATGNYKRGARSGYEQAAEGWAMWVPAEGWFRFVLFPSGLFSPLPVLASVSFHATASSQVVVDRFQTADLRFCGSADNALARLRGALFPGNFLTIFINDPGQVPMSEATLMAVGGCYDYFIHQKWNHENAEFVLVSDPSLTEQYEYAAEHDIKCLIIITEASLTQSGLVKL